jgi:hypothetical protein
MAKGVPQEGLRLNISDGIEYKIGSVGIVDEALSISNPREYQNSLHSTFHTGHDIGIHPVSNNGCLR